MFSAHMGAFDGDLPSVLVPRRNLNKSRTARAQKSPTIALQYGGFTE